MFSIGCHGPILSVDIGPAQGSGVGLYFVTCRCTYCGNEFETQTYSTSLADAYREYTENLPAKVIDSDYTIIWKPTVYDMRTRLVDDYDSMYTDPSTLLGITALNHFISIGSSPDYATPVVGDNAREFSVDFPSMRNTVD